MPKNVMHMLDNLIENGSDQDIKVLAEGQRAALNILIDTVVPEIKASCDHRKDKDLHTAKGILLRTKVIGWLLFIMIIVSTVVAYLPEKIAMLSP